MELSQYGEDVDEIVVCADSASFLAFSELQLWDEGVFMIIRESRRRRCRAGAINELKIEKEIYSIEKCWC